MVTLIWLVDLRLFLLLFEFPALWDIWTPWCWCVLYWHHTQYNKYCKTIIFRCILISRFWSLENLRHFNFAFLQLPIHRWTSYSPRFFNVALTHPTSSHPTSSHPTSSFADATSARFSIVFFHYQGLADPKLYLFSTSENCLHLFTCT